jgi:DNA-binding CsgD family transcriptional regulator
MDDNNDAELIFAMLEGYEFSPGRKEALSKKLIRRIREMGISDPREICSYATYFLEWQSVPGRIKHMRSLDAKISQGDESLQMTFGEKDMSLDRLLNTSNPATLDESLDYLRDEIDKTYFQVMLELLKTGCFGDKHFDLSLPRSLELIRKRLSQVSSVFYVNNRVVIPRKRIKIVEGKNGELDITVGALKGETVSQIYKAHDLGKAACRVAKDLGVSYQTVLSYWKAADLGNPLESGEKTNGYWPIDKARQERIFEAYDLGLSANQAAEYVGVSPMTVLKYWRSRGLKVSKPGGERLALTPQEVQEVKKSRKKFNGHITNASNHLGYSRSTIRKIWNA